MRLRRWWKLLLRAILAIAVLFLLSLAALRFVDPPFTMVHAQRRIENLFSRKYRKNPVRKLMEWAMAPVADVVLGKRRVLELYLNVVEWAPGVYGAEAAARHHFGVPASRLSRQQAARLAAVLPSPLRRKPARMERYSATILARMRQMGW